jgi:hypothetical protein
VVSFTSRPLYPEERAILYPLDKEAGWLRTDLDDDVEKRKFLTLSGLEPRFLRRPARSQSLYRLSYQVNELNDLQRTPLASRVAH